MSYNTLQKYWSIKGRGYQESSSWRVEEVGMDVVVVQMTRAHLQ